MIDIFSVSYNIKNMKTNEFDYTLPKELIAQKPPTPRDSARLMVIEKTSGKIYHSIFSKIGNFLKKGDVIVLNDTKVLPARLFGKKLSTGGKVEILLLNPVKKTEKKLSWERRWKIIGRGKLKENQKIRFSKNFEGKIIKDLGLEKIIEFNIEGKKLSEFIFSLGKMPTPPYIKSRFPQKKLKLYYQTTYAKKLGSIAAPTAGFHFTNRLIKKLKKQGIIFKFITLHIGIGTFQPIKTENIENHKMMSEWAQITKSCADYLNKAKKRKQRIIACGTTVVRALEGFCQNREILPGEKQVNLFIYPPYHFKFIDGMITNFHLPKSTPLLMVCALAGKNLIFKAYREAIKQKYKFYSFGDAMLIV